MQFDLMLRAQFPRGDDMQARFNYLIMSVQWPGMPRSLALEPLHMMAAEVFPKLRQG
jgi:hypothetical protein